MLSANIGAELFTLFNVKRIRITTILHLAEFVLSIFFQIKILWFTEHSQLSV
jgi:hypothetical protein